MTYQKIKNLLWKNAPGILLIILTIVLIYIGIKGYDVTSKVDVDLIRECWILDENVLCQDNTKYPEDCCKYLKYYNEYNEDGYAIVNNSLIILKTNCCSDIHYREAYIKRRIL